ncbi:MAG: toll/interleukin-1 receptor domain-containing protein [Candidatus Eisenbacteria bacterium]|nr:toll/interleukin-1 receptor domain-containing protein [Candidatus Eisenbacteria bacterium]
MKPFLFISYARLDQQFALKLATDIISNGAEVWIDQWEVPIGEFFEPKIVNAISDSNFVLVLLSRDSIQSEWVRREVETAKTVEKRVGRRLLLPGRIDDCAIPIWISDKSYADFFVSYETAFRQLLLAIGGSPSKFADPGALVRQLLQARVSDGSMSLLTALYDRQLDYDGTWVDKKIVDNILSQLETPTSKFGISLDIDTGQIVGDVPLIFKDISALVQSLQNAHQVIVNGDRLIKELYNVPIGSTFATDPLYRTLILEIEARLRTPFRQILPMGEIDIDTGERKAQVLSISTVQELLHFTKVKLDLKPALPQIIEIAGIAAGTPFRPRVLAVGVEQWFFPTAGYNII